MDALAIIRHSEELTERNGLGFEEGYEYNTYRTLDAILEVDEESESNIEG